MEMEKIKILMNIHDDEIILDIGFNTIKKVFKKNQSI